MAMFKLGAGKKYTIAGFMAGFGMLAFGASAQAATYENALEGKATPVAGDTVGKIVEFTNKQYGLNNTNASVKKENKLDRKSTIFIGRDIIIPGLAEKVAQLKDGKKAANTDVALSQVAEEYESALPGTVQRVPLFEIKSDDQPVAVKAGFVLGNDDAQANIDKFVPPVVAGNEIANADAAVAKVYQDYASSRMESDKATAVVANNVEAHQEYASSRMKSDATVVAANDDTPRDGIVLSAAMDKQDAQAAQIALASTSKTHAAVPDSIAAQQQHMAELKTQVAQPVIVADTSANMTVIDQNLLKANPLTSAVEDDAKVCKADDKKVSDCETNKATVTEQIAALKKQIAELEATLAKIDCNCGPAAVVVPVEKPVEEPKTPTKHTVVPGDNLCKVADAFDVSAKALAEKNGVKGPKFVIHKGQIIDATGLATVKEGTECDTPVEKPVIKTVKTPIKGDVTGKTPHKKPTKYTPSSDDVCIPQRQKTLFGDFLAAKPSFKYMSTISDKFACCNKVGYLELDKYGKIKVQGGECRPDHGDREPPTKDTPDKPDDGFTGGCGPSCGGDDKPGRDPDGRGDDTPGRDKDNAGADIGSGRTTADGEGLGGDGKTGADNGGAVSNNDTTDARGETENNANNSADTNNAGTNTGNNNAGTNTGNNDTGNNDAGGNDTPGGDRGGRGDRSSLEEKNPAVQLAQWTAKARQLTYTI